MNLGCRVGWVLELMLAATPLALTVLHTQIEYLTVPPGEVVEFCPIWTVTQSAPVRCERVGEGEGLGDVDGERECEGDGLGLVLVLLVEDGLGLGDLVGLFEGLGLGEELPAGLGLVEEPLVVLLAVLGLGVPEALRLPPSMKADVAAVVPLAHGDPAGCADAASAGAIARPVTKKDPATTDTAARPARAKRTSKTTLLRAARLDIPPCRPPAAISPSISWLPD